MLIIFFFNSRCVSLNLGGPYAAFGGRDASRGLATFNVTSSDTEEYDDLSDLDTMEMESVREWEMQFKGNDQTLKLISWKLVSNRYLISVCRKIRICRPSIATRRRGNQLFRWRRRSIGIDKIKQREYHKYRLIRCKCTGHIR